MEIIFYCFFVGIIMFTIDYVSGFLVCEKKQMFKQGCISDLRRYNHALHGTKIKEIYNQSLKPTPGSAV